MVSRAALRGTGLAGPPRLLVEPPTPPISTVGEGARVEEQHDDWLLLLLPITLQRASSDWEGRGGGGQSEGGGSLPRGRKEGGRLARSSGRDDLG